jgi:hypothetical protein
MQEKPTYLLTAVDTSVSQKSFRLDHDIHDLY